MRHNMLPPKWTCSPQISIMCVHSLPIGIVCLGGSMSVCLCVCVCVCVCVCEYLSVCLCTVCFRLSNYVFVEGVSFSGYDYWVCLCQVTVWILSPLVLVHFEYVSSSVSVRVFQWESIMSVSLCLWP